MNERLRAWFYATGPLKVVGTLVAFVAVPAIIFALIFTDSLSAEVVKYALGPLILGVIAWAAWRFKAP